MPILLFFLSRDFTVKKLFHTKYLVLSYSMEVVSIISYLTSYIRKYKSYVSLRLKLEYKYYLIA